MKVQPRLSGTPAEAGVRVEDALSWVRQNMSQWNPCRSRGASSAGRTQAPCQDVSQWNPCRSRGARGKRLQRVFDIRVSVEPLPKQGCEARSLISSVPIPGLSGTPAEAGVRGVLVIATPGEDEESQWNPCRSRGARYRDRRDGRHRDVSVEPLPKQGCEGTGINQP